MSYDVAALRAHFPSLLSGTAHFDGPAGTQTPDVVGRAIAETITGPLSYRGTVAASELRADAVVGEFRSAFADLLGADPTGIIHGRSSTALTYEFSRILSANWGPDDQIVVSRLDHDANVRPWVQAAERTGATVAWIDFDPATAEIDPSSVEAAITDRTRLVAITAASNLLGTKPNVAAISAAAKAVGALTYVDGVHNTPHSFVDVEALGADFYVCSPYKFFGPHFAVLAGRPEVLEKLHPDKLIPASNEIPERFEYGALPYEVLAGGTAAVNFLAQVAPGGATGRRAQLQASLHAIDEHELRIAGRLLEGLAELPVVVHSVATRRTPTILLTIPGHRTVEAYSFLAARGVHAPAGSFYAHEAFQRLQLADTHATRLGVAPYTTDDDVDRVLAGLREFCA